MARQCALPCAASLLVLPCMWLLLQYTVLQGGRLPWHREEEPVKLPHLSPPLSSDPVSSLAALASLPPPVPPSPTCLPPPLPPPPPCPDPALSRPPHPV